MTDTKDDPANIREERAIVEESFSSDQNMVTIINHVREEYEKLENKTGGADNKDSHITEKKGKQLVSTKSVDPQIDNIVIEYHSIDKKIIDLPLHPATLTFVLKNVSVAVANGIRRVLMDEIPSPRLNIKPGSFSTTDHFMKEHFVRDRLSQIPLLRILNPDVQKMKFKVAATNKIQNTSGIALNTSGVSSKNLLVLASDITPVHGKLTNPIMNPTHELAELLEGSELKIDEIFIEYGIGRVHSTFAASCNGSIQNPDLEMYSDKDMRSKDGKASYGSGYKMSSLLANSREHKVCVTFPAMNEKSRDVHSKELLREAFQIIIGYNNIVRKEPRNYTVQEDGLNRTKIISPGMTDTISHIITTYFFELNPGIEHVSSKCIPHESNIIITILHKLTDEDINKKIDSCFEHVDSVMKLLKSQV